jgi:hypothetical protein
MKGMMVLDKALDWFGFSPTQPNGGRRHDHARDGSHRHTHGVIDPTIATTERGIWAIKWSFVNSSSYSAVAAPAMGHPTPGETPWPLPARA